MIDKNLSLLETLELSSKDHPIFAEMNKLIAKIGVTKEETNDILKLYSESILSDEGLSEKEVNEIVNKIIGISNYK